MLIHLSIKNFTLIKNLNLDLSNGLTVITGESGAGKSLLLQALEIGFGKKIDKQTLILENETCEISVLFDVSKNKEAQALLEKYEVFDSNQDCLIRRVITSDGRSKCYLNGTLVNLNLLREVTTQLVNIHGQHENQSLLEPNTQLLLLDHFADLQKEVIEINKIVSEWKKTKDLLTTISQQNIQQSRKELIEYHLEELNLHLPSSIEILKELEQEHQTLLHAEEIALKCQQAIEWLDQEKNGIIPKLYNLQTTLSPFTHLNSKFQPLINCFQQALIQTEEGLDELKSLSESFDFNPDRAAVLEKKLQKIYEIARKHNVPPHKLHEHRKNLETELQSMSSQVQTLKELQDKQNRLEKEYKIKAEQLTIKRQKAAADLEKEVTKHLKKLDINRPFSSNIKTDISYLPSNNGSDTVEFMIFPNQGNTPLPISKIASGGEMSRISLALQSVTAKQYAIPTLIFDEVDVGISGATAEIVGKLLKQISKNAQVICITHLAQVASQGDHHLLVQKKQISDQGIQSVVSLLDSKSKVKEIARLLGGVTITKQTLLHAEEMLGE